MHALIQVANAPVGVIDFLLDCRVALCAPRNDNLGNNACASPSLSLRAPKARGNPVNQSRAKHVQSLPIN